MGLFGEADVSEIPDNPNFVEEGVYPITLKKATVVTKKNQGDSPFEKFLSIRFVIDEDSEDEAGKPLYWRRIDIVDTAGRDGTDFTPEEVTQMSRLKQALSIFGVSEEDMNADDVLENLSGIQGYGTVVVNFSDDGESKYSNLIKFRLPED